MCRHVAYLGKPIRLSQLLFEPPHSLSHQSYQPRDMRKGGTVNADGFGVGWYAEGAALRLRRAAPIWTDADLRTLAEHTTASAMLAAVRSATAGMPVTETASAPFTDGHRLFSLNGRIGGWPHSVAELAAELPIAELLTLDAPTDAAFVWALLRQRLRDGVDPAETVRALVGDIAALAPDSRLNLLYTDGVQIAATTWTHALSVRHTDSGVTIASEPLDGDPAWESVDDRSLVSATATGYTATGLKFLSGGNTMLHSHISEADLDAALRADVRAGLTATPKSLSPRWFYDAHGSELFERITRLPEYYPTRAEAAALELGADRVAERTGATALIELGSGSSRKTRLLLDALRRKGTLASFTGFDVSAAALGEATAELTRRYPGLRVDGIVGDFTAHLRHLPAEGDRLVAFLGGTIGNLPPRPRAAFLAALREQLAPGEWLLLGTDLVKDPAVLVAAYDDAAGVTAAFNRNVLSVLNRRLGANFDLSAFGHVALWDPQAEWIEMRLRAQRAQRVDIPALDLSVDFAAGEELRTEVSAKFQLAGLAGELDVAGFTVGDWWTDPEGRFGLSLAQAV